MTLTNFIHAKKLDMYTALVYTQAHLPRYVSSVISNRKSVLKLYRGNYVRDLLEVHTSGDSIVDAW